MKVLILIVLFASLGQVFAQEEDTLAAFNRKVRNKLRNYNFAQQTLNYATLSYVSPTGLDRGSPKEWYVLSADVIPQFVFGGDWMRFVVHVTPRYKVRILHNNELEGDSSSAVRTPSYMPGATVYFPVRFFDAENKKLRYVSLAFFHHSNGQDGNEFNEDGTINRYNGNFSTNFFEPAFHFVNRELSGKTDTRICKDAEPHYWDLYGRAGYEIHVNTTNDLKSSYGRQRLNLTLGLIRVINYCDRVRKRPVGESYYRERWRGVFNATIITDARDRDLSGFENRVNADLSFHYRIPSSPNTSGFLSVGYWGSDQYNIYFEDNYFFIRAGLSLGFFVTPNMLGLKSQGTRENKRDFETP